MGYTATTSDSRTTTLIDGIDGKFLNISYVLDMDRDRLAVIGRITPLLSAS